MPRAHRGDRTRPCWRAVALAWALPALLYDVAWSQTIFVKPEATIGVEYDDNIFASPEREADVLATIRPGLRVEARHERLTLALYGWLRGEYFAEHEELNNLDNWGGDTEIQYEPVRTLRISLIDTFLRTLDVGEIDPETGLTTGRVRSTRNTATPSLHYDMDRFTSVDLRYSFDFFRSDAPTLRSSDTHTVEGALHRQFLGRDIATLRYTFARFEVEDRGTQDSHAPRVGLTHAFSPTVRVTAEAGPVLLDQPDGTTELNAGGVLRYEHEFKQGNVSLGYDRAPGLAGRVEGAGISQGVTAAARVAPAKVLDLNLAAGARDTETERGDVRTYLVNLGIGYQPPVRDLSTAMNVGVTETEGVTEFRRYLAGVRLSYRVLRWLAIEASYRYSLQDDRAGPLDVERSVLMLGVTARDQFRVR